MRVIVPLLLGLLTLGGPTGAPEVERLIAGERETELAPHGQGNVYAPEFVVEDGRWRIWYGGQGRDGHDRIHYAESKDGRHWVRRGVVLEDVEANHVNDPSLVKVHGTDFMYSSRAGEGVLDEIALATADDGIRWRKRGIVLRPGPDGAWDSLLVGRPSVLFEDGQFKMWYDGRKDLPIAAPAGDGPRSPTSRRSVGYATSTDGVRWTKYPGNPVFDHDAGGVDVERVGDAYVMVYESRSGTKAAISRDGIAWRDAGLLVPRSNEPIDRHGHVTPALVAGDRDRPWTLVFGAASAETWDHNAIARIELAPGWIDRLTRGGVDKAPE